MAIDFTPEFSIPYFMAACVPVDKDPAEILPDNAPNQRKIMGARKAFYVAYDRVLPRPVIQENERGFTLLLGHPIVDGNISQTAAINALFHDNNVSEDRAVKLNGEFLFIHFDKTTDALTLVNDRFTAFPAYYYHDVSDDSFYVTPYFSDLWFLLDKIDRLRIREEAILEFLFFQRLLGAKTYAVGALYLPDASILRFEDETIELSRYWKRNYEKNRNSLKENARLMATLTRESVRRKSSDNKRYGHFLSGGMDSRSVLAAFTENPPVCFTATISENRECQTARAIAQAKGAKHVWLTLAPEHYGQILDVSVRVNGGMYNYDHGLFYGFNKTVSDLTDACFHGHGFDYMFQGMYIPRHRYQLGGRTLNYVRLAPLPEDLVTYFIQNVSYRVKGANIMSYLKPGRRDEAMEELREAVNEILNQAQTLSDNPYDHWEHLTFHHISRHYSYPNHASMATFVEQRTISFDNDVFDFYLSLPIQHRFDARVERRCLNILDPKLAAIPSANTDLPVTASSFQQTVYQVAEFAKRRLFGFQDYEGWTERTWPDRTWALREQKTLRQAVKNMVASDAFEKVGFLDADKLRQDIPRWLTGENIPSLSGDFVQTLLSLSVFLNQKP